MLRHSHGHVIGKTQHDSPGIELGDELDQLEDAGFLPDQPLRPERALLSSLGSDELGFLDGESEYPLPVGIGGTTLVRPDAALEDIISGCGAVPAYLDGELLEGDEVVFHGVALHGV